MIYCGIDWAERTHDVALVDDTGQLLAKRHITDDAAGYKLLLDLLAEDGDTEENPIDGLPRTVAFRQVTPRDTGSDPEQDPVDHGAVVVPPAAPATWRWQMRVQ